MHATTSRIKGEKTINGIVIPVITYNAGCYFLTQMEIYADGLILCWGSTDIEGLKKHLETGFIVVDLPPGSLLQLNSNWGIIEVSKFDCYKSKEDFIKEVEDIINDLNGRINRINTCRELFKYYLINPSENNFELLRNAFQDLPGNHKVIMDYVDYKDPLVGLMTRGETFTKEQRYYILDDYFEGE